MPMVIPVIASVAAASIATSSAVIAAIGVIGASVLGMAAAFSITMIGQKVFGKVKEPSISQQDLKRTIKESAANRRIIYGTVRTGGVLIYAASSGKSNNYLDMVIALAHGRINHIDPVFWINDDKTDDPKFKDLIYMQERLGHKQQSAIGMLVKNKPEEWSESHTLNGIAYVYVRLKYDGNAFQNGVPNLSFLVQGRPVYDPRICQMVHSNNPALCILDWLRSKEGKDAPNELIDFDSFITAANICDELVPSKDTGYEVDRRPGFVKRYTLDGVIDMSAAPSKIIEDMQSSCHGNLVFAQGKYRFYAGAFSHPTFTITSEMLRDAPTIRMKPSRNELFNVVSGSYIEPKHNWSETDFPPQRHDGYIKRYQGEEIKQDIKLPFTTNAAIAQRLSKIQLIKGNNTVTVNLSCNWAVLPVRLWDMVELNIPEIHAVGKTFRVIEFSFAEGGGIDLALTSETPDFYDWDHEIDEKIINPPKKPVSDDGKPSEVKEIKASGEADSNGKAKVSAYWPAAEPNPVTYNVVLRRRHPNSQKFAVVAMVNTLDTRYDHYLNQDEIGFIYKFEICVRRIGFARDSKVVFSDEVIPQLSPAKPPEPPTNISLMSTGAEQKAVTIRWMSSLSVDHASSKIYKSSTDNFSDAVVFEVVPSNKSTYLSHTDVVTTNTYYWISSVDVSNQESQAIFAGQVIF